MELLAKKFVSYGWRISRFDEVRTINSLIANEWAQKPWDVNSGVDSLVKNGEMLFYEGLTVDQMNYFYKTYLKEVEYLTSIF